MSLAYKYNVYVTALGLTWESIGWRGCIDQNVQEKTKTSAVFPFQRHTGLWHNTYQQEKSK